VKAKRQFAADRKAASASVSASLSEYFTCSSGLESENTHTGPGSDHSNNRRQSARSVRSESSEDLQCSEAFCVDSCVEGSERASRPISHCRLENALPAAENLNKDGNADNGEEGRGLEGGTEGEQEK
jgi:hypothetical protein